MNEVRIRDILEYLDGECIEYTFQGNKQTMIHGFSSMKKCGEGKMTWAKNEKALAYGLDRAGVVIAQKGLPVCKTNVIFSEESKRAFFQTIEHFFGMSQKEPGIGPGTYIGNNVRIKPGVRIGNHCVIDGNITIEEGTVIWNHVTMINRITVGKHCEIQSGTVIGHDGFSWNEAEDHTKTMIRHYGGVEIQDQVHIGPNCIIDRGTIDDTVIHKGAKIDGNCFVAHNVEIGANSILITGSKLYGSARLGENAYIASGMVRNQGVVGDNAMLGMGAVAVKDVPDNTVVVGNPAGFLRRKET